MGIVPPKKYGVPYPHTFVKQHYLSSEDNNVCNGAYIIVYSLIITMHVTMNNNEIFFCKLITIIFRTCLDGGK